MAKFALIWEKSSNCDHSISKHFPVQPKYLVQLCKSIFGGRPQKLGLCVAVVPLVLGRRLVLHEERNFNY